MEAARRLIGIALLWASAAGCQLRTFERATDAGVDAEVIPDASVCVDLRKECVASTVLRDCQQVDQLPMDIPCPWGCLDGTPPARCGLLQPAADVLEEDDLKPDPALLDHTASSADGQINGETGEITGLRSAGPSVINGIEFERRDVGGRDVGVFRFGKLTMTGRWRVTGDNPIVIASLGEVVIRGRLELSGECSGSEGGPGGFDGADATTGASGLGGGEGGNAGGGGRADGGGGGGYGAAGGDAGNEGQSRPKGGSAFGNPEITVLHGGGGGGGGAGPGGGRGGGGGGAIHIAANGKVTIGFDTLAQPSGINAGGCGGEGGTADGGGGGGAGGTILIEAPEVELDGGHLAVNGGGGGGGNNAGGPGNGKDGTLDGVRAGGGQAGPGGAAGGQGGAAGNRAGAQGGDANEAGGGGGAVGRIRINTRVMNAVTLRNLATVSPTFEEAGSTSTKGVAAVQ